MTSTKTVLPGAVPEYFVSCLGHIEVMGAVSRHIWLEERHVGKKILLIPKVEIITTNTAVHDGILKQARALAIALIGFEETFLH